MWITAAYRQTQSSSRLAWSEGWQTPGAEFAFIKWTRWTLEPTLAVMTDHKNCRGIIIIIIIITANFIRLDARSLTAIVFAPFDTL